MLNPLKKAFITGITGQDGSHLAELLVKKNYKVFGLVRNTKQASLVNIEKLYKDKKITKEDVSNILGCGIFYVDWLVDKWYNKLEQPSD